MHGSGMCWRERGRWLSAVALVLLLLSVAVACGDEDDAPDEDAVVLGDLRLTDARLSAPPTDAAAALYLTIENTGSSEDRLVAASFPFAAAAELHESRMEGDRSRMVHLPDGVAIPPGGRVHLAPGGLHVMALGLDPVPAAGDAAEVTLRFERAGEVTLRVPVVAPGDLEADDHGDETGDTSHDDTAHEPGGDGDGS